MALYETWVKKAYDQNAKPVKSFWNEYLPKEQAVYEKFLEEKQNSFSGTVKELAEKFNLTEYEMAGFIDGISAALDEEIDLENIDENTMVNAHFEFESLYKKMVEYKAQHLHNLPGWDSIIAPERQKILYTEQKKSGTIVKEKKVGRNDPCPCGSGKKYKKCCGLNENND